MAKAFNLSIQLQLAGPKNLKGVVSQINSQLKNIQANVNVKIAKNLQKNVTSLNQSFTAFNSTLAKTQTAGNNAAQALNALSAAVSSLRSASGTLNNTNKSIGQTSKALGEATNQAAAFGKAAGLAFKRYAAFAGITGAIFGLGRAISSGVSDAISFQKELVKLSQVSGLSLRGLEGLSGEVTRLSTKLGVSSKDLIEVATTLNQAGLSIRDTQKALEALAKSALAPSFGNLNDTVEGSIALMAQFGIQAKDLGKALGSINKVSADFAVEAEDIVAAIKLAGGVFAATSKGVSQGTDALNEFIAVFTSVRATTRESAESIATGLRTIFTRIQRGETVDALREFGVELADLEGKFIGPYKAVEALAQQLNKLDPRDFRFSQIVEELGGYRQIGKVIPLIQQTELRVKALKAAQEGLNSLDNDSATAQLSLANRLSKVREEFTALIREVSETESFKAILSIIIDTTTGLIQLAKAFKGVIPFLTAFAAIKFTQNALAVGKGFVSAFKPQGKNDGGVVHKFARGGLVPGSGNGDTVPAMLQPGEFVLRKKAVQAIGAKNLFAKNKFADGGQPTGGFTPSGIARTLANYTTLLKTNKKYKSLDDDTKSILSSIPNTLTETEAAAYLQANPTKAAVLEQGLKVKPVQKQVIAAQTAKANKDAKRKKAIEEGKAKVNFGLAGEEPLFGAIAFQKGNSFKGLRSAYSFKSDQQDKIDKISKKLGIKPEQLGNFRSSYSANLIDPHVQDTFESEFKTRFADTIEDLANSYTKGIPQFQGASSAAVTSIEKNLSPSVLGFGFESLIAAISKQALSQDTKQNFDFPISGNRDKLEHLFGKIPPSVKYLDAKRSLGSAFSGKSGSVPFKAINQILGSNIPIKTLGKTTKSSIVSPGQGFTIRDFKDSLSQSDTKTKQVFARGGLVQHFATGGPVRDLDFKSPTLSRKSLGLGRSATDILQKGAIRGDETVTSIDQVRNIANKIAAYYKVNPGFLKGIKELDKQKEDEFKLKAFGTTDTSSKVNALFEHGTLFFKPGQTTTRSVVHELGHAFDRQMGRQIGSTGENAAGEDTGKYASRVPGSAANKLAASFQKTRSAQLQSEKIKTLSRITKKGFTPSAKFVQGLDSRIENRSIPEELLADAFSKKVFTDKSLLKKLRLFANGGSTGTDTVPAMLTPGEFVINKKAAQRIGYDNLKKMNHADKFAKGGPVRMAAGGKAPSVTLPGGQKVVLPGIDKAYSDLAQVLGSQAQAGKVLNDALKQFTKDLTTAGVKGKALEKGLRDYVGSINDGTASQKRNNEIIKRSIKNQKATTDIGLGTNTRNFGRKQATAFNQSSFGIGANNFFSGKNSGLLGKVGGGLGKVGGKLGGFGGKVAGGLANAAVPLALFGGGLVQQALPDTPNGRVTGSTVSGALGGASVGASIGGPFAPLTAGIGALVGGIVSYTNALDEENDRIKKIQIAASLEKIETVFEKFSKTDNIRDANEALVEANVARKQVKTKQISAGQASFKALSDNFLGGLGVVGRLASGDLDAGNNTVRAQREQDRKEREQRVNASVDEAQPFAALGGRALEAKIGKLFEDKNLSSDEIKSKILNDTDNVQTFTVANNKKALQLEKTLDDLKNNGGSQQDIDATQRAFNEELAKGKKVLADVLEAQSKGRDIAIKLEKAQKANLEAQLKSALALAKFTQALDQADANIARFEAQSRVNEESFNITKNRASGGKFDFTDPILAVLDNPLAFSKEERAQRSQAIQNFAGGNNKGLAAVTQGAAGFKDFQENIREAIIKANGGSFAEGKDSEAGIKKFIQSFQGIDATVKDGMLKGITEAFAGNEGEGKVEGAALTKSIDIVTNAFGDLFKKFPELEAKLEKAFIEAQNNLRAGFAAYTDVQLEQNARIRRVLSLQDNLNNQLAQLKGKELTIEDQARPVENQVRALTGGEVDPVEIGRTIKAQQTVLAKNTDNQTFNPTAFDDKNREATKATVDLAAKLEENKQALEILASDTTKLSAIQDKLSKIQASKEERKGQIAGVLGSSTTELVRKSQIANAITSGKKLRGQAFQEGQALVREASLGKTDEEKKKIEDTFLKSQLTKDQFNNLSQEQRDAFLGKGESGPEKALIAQFEKAAEIQIQAAKELAKLPNATAVFDKAVANFLDASNRFAKIIPDTIANGPGVPTIPGQPAAPASGAAPANATASTTPPVSAIPLMKTDAAGEAFRQAQVSAATTAGLPAMSQQELQAELPGAFVKRGGLKATNSGIMLPSNGDVEQQFLQQQLGNKFSNLSPVQKLSFQGGREQNGVNNNTGKSAEINYEQQLAPFVAATQSLAQTAEILSKIPTKIEAVMTINPVQVIINGADVFRELEPAFQNMVVSAVKDAMDSRFNVDGTQRT